MTRRYDRNAFAGLWTAQEARRADARSGNHDYANSTGTRFDRSLATIEGVCAIEQARITSLPPALERDVLAACLEALAIHPAVAWAERMNVGGMYDKTGQFVRFGFKGCSDIIGMLRSGRFLAVECKREQGGRLTDEQAAFLKRVNDSGGVAFVARSVDDIIAGLRGK